MLLLARVLGWGVNGLFFGLFLVCFVPPWFFVLLFRLLVAVLMVYVLLLLLYWLWQSWIRFSSGTKDTVNRMFRMKTCINLGLWGDNGDMLNPYMIITDIEMHWLIWVITSLQILGKGNFVFLQDHMESPEAHFKNQWFSKAEHIVCTCWFHSGMQRASLLGNKHSPLTCLSPLCSADAVLGAGDVLTSWWVLSVLLHSSFRFSSSLSLCFCNRRRVAEDGVPPRTFSANGLCPRPSVSTPGKPVVPEPRPSSRPVFSPLLYSAQRFRMVSSRCLSCGKMRDIRLGFEPSLFFLIFSLWLLKPCNRIWV